VPGFVLGPLTHTTRIARALAVVFIIGCALAAPASAALIEGYHTQLISKPLAGGPPPTGKLPVGISLPPGLPFPSGTPVPTGVSGGPTISHDKRIGRYVAYHSNADNIVEGDTNARTDVFVVPRDGPWGRDGTPWRPGRPFIASRGLDGQQSNGDSWAPALDGGSHYAPRCVAFLSSASNLVPGDTNGVADVFVYSLHSGAIRRVSVSSREEQANGPSTQVAVNNNCDRVAFTSEANNLAPGVAATPQVYVRFVGGRGAGTTRVASATRRGRPGDGPSFDPDMPNWGRNVTFASRAANLGAHGGRSQVFLKQLPTRRSRGRRLSLRMVSRTRGGSQGDGDSTDPSATYDGRIVAYTTTAPNLGGSGSQIVQTSARSRHTRRVSHGANGDSYHPSMTDAASWVFFVSRATNLARNDQRTPRAASIYLWFKSVGWRWIKSDPTVNAAVSSPETSMHGNYLVYERAGMVWLEYLGDK
jgi:hypothetical protein